MTAELACGVIVIAKRPVAGRAKTRLQSEFSPQQAAGLAEAALRDTLAVAEQAAWHCVAWDDLGTPGRPDWLSGWVFAQTDGNLGKRLDAAFATARAQTDLPLILLGMDTPQVTPGHLSQVLTQLRDHDFSLGLAADGGFWTLGCNAQVPTGLESVPMSEVDTGANTLSLLRDQGSVAQAHVLEDVDDPASARRVAKAAPATRFARTLAQELSVGQDLAGSGSRR